ncbi:MAG: hypothetical protein A4E42_00188 [Methanoregulaceae archaeon PtaU1.Bin222]|nr:MAG: hypothetical protein A4E42_00188 [Methanoregulaceae archaeon PtaU1.Bin222]
MARKENIPELLERFMDESGETQQWVTVNELRTRFSLDEFAAPAISGFLRRIYQGPFATCPYRVERIEKISVQNPHRRDIKRYLVVRRPVPRIKNLQENCAQSDRTDGSPVFTDYDAVGHLDRILRQGRNRVK